jgi:hypothetical protein
MMAPMQSDRLRNALSFAVVCGFTLMLAGTSKSKQDASNPPPPPTTPTSTPTLTPTNQLSGAPDVDLKVVDALVGCPKSGHPACRLLTDFALGTPYNDTPASPNDVVWYGETIGLGGPGNMKKEYFFVQVEGTPDGPNASPRSLIPGNAKETKEASDLVAALRSNKPLPQNSALSYIKTTGSTNMKRLMKSGGTSTEFQTELPRMTYMRRIGNRLLVLEYTGSSLGHGGNGAVSANGWIAETWVVSR